MPDIEREAVEKLKRSWLNDPCWDLEDTEGFETYRQELKEFSDKAKTDAELAAKKEHDRRASFLCPMTFSAPFITGCFVEKCAWWSSANNRCGMLNR